MEKLCELIKQELQDIEQQGLNESNVEFASTLVEMKKNISEMQEKEGGKMRGYSDYRDGGYGDNYRDGGYGRYFDSDYGRRGVPGSGRYRNDGYNDGRSYRDEEYGHVGRERGRFDDNLDRLADCVEMYEYARGRYREGGSEERMAEGLEKLMYSLCMFVESAMNFAESPKEKEIIRKHVQKLQSI